MALALGCQTPSKSGLVSSTCEHGAAELAMMAAFDLAAELLGHGLLAVADAEHGDAGLEDGVGCARAIDFRHRGRAARQNHRGRLELGKRVGSGLEGVDFAVDPASRTRRAMSWVTWLPKSMIRTGADIGCWSLPGTPMIAAVDHPAAQASSAPGVEQSRRRCCRKVLTFRIIVTGR